LVIKRRDGRYLCVSMSAALLRDRSGKVLGTLGISKDITPRVELERRLREISITDELTGLYNKRHLRERLADEAQRARRQRHRLSLLLIDLDGFKRVNDSLGHQAGDRMLRDFAEVLRRGIRGRVDAAFRYGGDEFVVLLPGQTTARALQIAKRLAEDTRKASGVEISYGAASLRRAGSASELLGTADERMYRMKRSGRRRRPG
ncbi:MAG: diguanylate cyclase, partial [Elusimicrobia bacterium]|nr:diguanylate cyclase [Elusimicrobiota bacterium]